MRKIILYFLGGCFFIFFFLFIIWAFSNLKMHDFQGKCSLCHVNIPDKETKIQDMIFVDKVDRLCRQCHSINEQMSHPIKVKPKKDIPLAAHLDKNGEMTCATCHDVHKEDKVSNRLEASGLLWGHAQGKTFCLLCHNKEILDASWRHQTAITYAHPLGKLSENAGGSLLDKFSAECLSCHDGTISKGPTFEVKQGLWQHGIGMSHPVGVDYPRSGDFTYPEVLPKEIKLFEGRVGCLSCHEIYTKGENLLVMSNKNSRLCLSCHKK